MDHPRSRGVYRLTEAVRVFRRGSSPLARGLPERRGDYLRSIRIIPARAGFTRPRRQRRPRRPDHPRSRGVYLLATAFEAGQQGSSPLARGLPELAGPPPGAGWIIPARAGFTPPGPGRVEGRGDHPRSRGVYTIDMNEELARAGSSPLARGLRDEREQPRPLPGIIPARAGFTARPAAPPQMDRDHPRSRGVYRGRAAPSCPTQGSSPLARGLQTGYEAWREKNRIIPARAGFTRRRPTGGWAPRDHPRSRGVYAGSVSTTTISEGSSPLARGLLPMRETQLPRQRIIPARAGFTRTSG